MLKKRLWVVAGILLFCVISGFILINLNAINDEITRFRTNRSLGEAKITFSDAIHQIPLESDTLISSELKMPYIPDGRPACIVSYSYQVFSSNNHYDEIRSTFVDKFASLGWISSRTKYTPDVQINFQNPDKHLRIAIFPLSEFEAYKIDVQDSWLDEETVYAIHYTYEWPDEETCFLAS